MTSCISVIGTGDLPFLSPLSAAHLVLQTGPRDRAIPDLSLVPPNTVSSRVSDDHHLLAVPADPGRGPAIYQEGLELPRRDINRELVTHVPGERTLRSTVVTC